MLLPEIGTSGQERLRRGRTLLPVADGATEPSARAVAHAADYLRRAGVGQVLSSEEAPRPGFPHRALFRHAPSRDLGSGAWLALDCLKKLLTETR